MTRERFRVGDPTYHDTGRGLTLGEVEVLAPGGRAVVRRFLHTPEVVAVVAVVSGDLVLIREFRAAVATEVLQVPMGKIATGELPLDRARRELAEETGFDASCWHPVSRLHACPGWTDQRLHVFLATGLAARGRHQDPDDPDDVEEQNLTQVRLPVREFAAAVRTGLVVDARTIAAVYAAALTDRSGELLTLLGVSR